MIDVQLYIYDLSNGMAKQMSLGFLGEQIDAIYHTSIVMNSLEYVYDGGVKIVSAGKTHLGPPLKTVFLGKTELPMEVILEYLESLKEIYNEKAYDIWTHNCNNFSNDFATFLVGHGIPSYISNLPETVLKTPFGQMLKPYIDQIARQAQANKGGLLGIEGTAESRPSNENRNLVHLASSVNELDNYLQNSQNFCAIVFFTSQNCGPCKALYPLYQKKAIEFEEVIFLMVDVAKSIEIGMKYSITATPTFITFLHGSQESRWTGSDPSSLHSNLKMLLLLAHPSHPHESLPLPEFFSADSQPILYTKMPPLSKLKVKLGPCAENDVVLEILNFISSGISEESTKLPCPDLNAFSKFLWSAPSELPLEVLFAIVDLFRIGLADPTFNAYFTNEKDHKTVALIISHVNCLENCPYSLRLVTLQLSCNLFLNEKYQHNVLGCASLYEPIIQLATNSLLDDKNQNVRVAAASLAFNLAITNQKARFDKKNKEILPEAQQLELAASLLEAINAEEHSAEALKGCLLALANLVFRAPKDGELVDLLKSMASNEIILSKQNHFPKEPLIDEIGNVLLGKGIP
ncbi:putative pul domain-containing protein [Erysiphe necator]|uniref:Putative pul domain-containing protein n=1 Tax=Uncinula necator TaxID=52586 RepID=A0A0B1PF24_UNCNE|nr:putative pul domain-containing protein [Erysiphe necator]